MYHTGKPVCNDHLYNKIYYLWFIQLCVLMMTEGTNLLVLTISAFWSSRRQRSIPLGGRYRQVSPYYITCDKEFDDFHVYIIGILCGWPAGWKHWTHWGRDKMAAIFQTTFSSAFSWMKMFVFRFKFHWRLFLRVQLTIFQHWLR